VLSGIGACCADGSICFLLIYLLLPSAESRICYNAMTLLQCDDFYEKRCREKRTYECKNSKRACIHVDGDRIRQFMLILTTLKSLREAVNVLTYSVAYFSKKIKKNI
jgi:hypothetical protein